MWKYILLGSFVVGVIALNIWHHLHPPTKEDKERADDTRFFFSP